jgi:hypothetical protein
VARASGELQAPKWYAKLIDQTDITKDDSSSADQLREAFRGMAGDKVSNICDNP